MTDISKIDKNFAVNTKIQKDDIKFYNIDESPFKIYGIFRENEKYRRMPEDVAKNVSRGVYSLHSNTAGGRVRFVTDSAYVAIYAEMDGLGKMPHFAFTGAIGFDMYVDNVYTKTFVPPIQIESGFESLHDFKTKEKRNITINFPLYSNVKTLYIGLQNDALVSEHADYKTEKPIVYYGSSITQGGCASRPGMSYQSIISRKFDCNYINLGFSGNAKAEDVMIDYVRTLDMSVFVYDYDHNAPNAEHLRNTHEKMFKAIREAHPSLPIIMMPRPKFELTNAEKERRDIIKTTYNNAIAVGDKNVYYISEKELTALCENEGTVDGAHPTDFGFASMANAASKVLEKLDF